MSEALVLLHPGQLRGFVTGEAVRHQRSGVVARDEFPHLLIAMFPPNLINRLLVGIEGHQIRSVAADPPARVVGVSDRRMPHLLAQFLIGGADGPLGLSERVLRDGALGDRDPRHFPQNGWQPAHRDSVSIVLLMTGMAITQSAITQDALR